MIELGRMDHGYIIAAAAGTLLNPVYDIVISRSKGAELLGGVIFCNFTGKSIGLHMAGFTPRWMCKDLIWLTFHYAFVQLGCDSLFVQIRSGNIKTIELSKKIGFTLEATIPEVFPEDDLVVYRLRVKDCKWLNVKPKNLTFRGNGGLNGRQS